MPYKTKPRLGQEFIKNDLAAWCGSRDFYFSCP